MEGTIPLLQAAGVLPPEIRKCLFALPQTAMLRCEEVRLRVGRGVTWLDGGNERPLLRDREEIPVKVSDLHMVLELATRSSYQIAADKLGHGFYTIQGGHRIGVTGCVTMRGGTVQAFRTLSSLALRVARAIPGCPPEVVDRLLEEGRFPSTLILAPPGAGKTTLLRAMICALSDRHGLRVALADERGEVAALWSGVPQFPVGRHTDVLDGCPKAEGMMLLLRSMNPQILAADEITAPEDIDAISRAGNCGVSVLATAHGAGRDELLRLLLFRLQYRLLR